MAGWNILPGVKGAAIFHTEKEGVPRRWALHREWAKPGQIITVANQPNTLVSIGMNPSLADAERDDPTVRKEYRFAMSFSCYSRYTKFNACDAISSDPKQLLAVKMPNARGHHRFIINSLKNMQADIVCNWGILPKGLEEIAEELLVKLRKEGHTLYCYKINKNGTPAHPRFINLEDMKLNRYF